MPTPGRFAPRPSQSWTRRRRRGHFFPLPAFYLLLLLCVISWTATHTTASWDYTTYNPRHREEHRLPQRHHSRDTYTPFPGRVVNNKRNGMAGMGFLEMMGRARGAGVAVTRPLGSYAGKAGKKGGGGRGGVNPGGNHSGGKGRYEVARLDDAITAPVGEMTVDSDDGTGELKRGRMVFVEELDG
ncbi:hypothetical protein QBC41DRAFT_215153 [Cercophora samala]|uniref:Uncharacterized protein n=1 Tax=Cercophora samala TaxID=330535 RepID=A0AA39ZLI1_9PEZI|nr:hypothetical protein QBC41DRAFT_215153 [Cercophora samala]